jgi:hypothetical protein
MRHPRAGRPGEEAPVKYLAAILAGLGFDVEGLLFPALEERFGRIDYRGPAHAFTVTDYYADEMGPDLHRMLVSFERLGSATGLVSAKLAAAAVEEELAESGSRRVNVDPGYMDYYKIVLASFKEGPQKIYLGGGVYADPVLMFHEGEYGPLPWTFPDFREGVYRDDLHAIRMLYKSARRENGRNGPRRTADPGGAGSEKPRL